MLETRADYVRLFTNAAFWSPYIEQVCRHHKLGPCQPVRSGLPGTYPTFIVAERWVVKFFGRLFEGREAFQIEHETARLLTRVPGLPVPALIGAGQLFPEDSEWPWPYLIFEFIPALSLGEAEPPVPPEQMPELAHFFGSLVRKLHSLDLEGSACFPSSWDPYLAFLAEQRQSCRARHQEWGSLPSHLLAQLDQYLLEPPDLLEAGIRPHLIHADLTRDHLLGRWENGRWLLLGLIDFGDAMVGSLYYELAALHLDCFGGDKASLRAFLEGYGSEIWNEAAFARKAMSAALLHRFNLFGAGLEGESLEAIETDLWR